MEKLIIISGLIYVALWVVFIIKILKVKRQLKVDISCDTSDFNTKLDLAQLEIEKVKYTELLNKNCELVDKLNTAESTIENLTNERDMERKKRLDVMMEYDLEVKEHEELKAKQWGEKEYEHYKSKI